MQLRNNTPKRRVKAKLREDREDAVTANDALAMDFVHDQLATGRKIRILTVVDMVSLYVPVLDARFSYKGGDVVAALDRTCRQTGYPKTICTEALRSCSCYDESNGAMSGRLEVGIKRWTAERKSALVL